MTSSEFAAWAEKKAKDLSEASESDILYALYALRIRSLRESAASVESLALRSDASYAPDHLRKAAEAVVRYAPNRTRLIEAMDSMP